MSSSPAATGTATATSTASAIAVDGLRVRRGGRVVLDRVSTELPTGTVAGLLGPSGCGKSTLLRSIMGVQRIEAGDVRVLGEPAGSKGLRSRVAYMTQAPSVYADLTVAENLAYFARVLDAPGTDVDRVTEAVGLEPMTGRLVGGLSGGERARASLATALLGRPEVLVLDEPTVGLDPVLRRDLWALFHRLADDGATLLVSSHVMDEAARCTRLLLMRDGRLLADTTPDGLLRDTGAPDVEAAFLALVEQTP
jgi:ABC-2 type transport system ATP-binding protein